MGVRLPAEYQEVEYLESVGGQYIDLPAPIGTVTIEAIISSDTQMAIIPTDVFGVVVNNANRLQLSQQSGNVIFAGFGATYKSDVAGVFTDGAWHTVSLSNDGLILDGAKIWDTNQVVFNSNVPLHLFASYNLNRLSTGLRTKLIRYTSNGEDYVCVPCYRKSDGKTGIYDIIHNTFRANQGTDEFAVGGNVIDSISPWLVARRRMLMNPYWDYVWTYEDGLLSDNGWTKQITGTAAETLTNDGLKIASNKSSSGSLQNYVFLSNSDYNMQSGIMEVVFVPVSIDNPAIGASNTRICLSNGTNGITLFFSDGKWRFMTGTASTSQVLWNFAGLNREYKIRIELINGIGNIWIGDVQVASNLNSSDGLYSGVTAIWSQNQGGYSLIKSVKIKKL